jgi:hypothetical protein
VTVDAKGAQELARRLDALHGERVDAPPEPLKTADAAPIFHWFGIEPAGMADAEEEAPVRPSRMRRR